MEEEFVMIYEDPLTKTRPEGLAKPIMHIQGNYWLVEFLDGDIACRQIITTAKQGG